MNEIPLTLAISDYDHVRDLTSGKVRAEGITLTCLDLTIPEIFARFTADREWDVSEIGLGKYVALRSQGDDSMLAIPVFPSRIFRQSALYVRSDSPLDDARQLAGKRVGLPEWAQTAAIYCRGWLAHNCGVDLASIEWHQAGVDEIVIVFDAVMPEDIRRDTERFHREVLEPYRDASRAVAR